MPLHAVRPKILGFISEQVSAWLVAVVVLLGGIALTIVVAWAASELYQQQMRQRFQLLVNERYSRLQERFEDQEQRLGSLRRFFVNSNTVSRKEFEGFAQPLLLRTRAYAWAPRVLRDQRGAFEQAITAERGANFSIRELNAAGELTPATDRDEYVPVLYSQTQSILGSPLGFDLLAQPLRRSTVERAQQSGKMAVSQPMQLVGVEPAYAMGVLLVAPVSRAPTTQVPNSEPYGYVMAVISMRQLVADGLPKAARDNLVMQIVDTSDAEQRVLYESSNPVANSDLVAARRLTLGDHVYALSLRPSQVFQQGNHSSLVSILVMGSLLSVLLSALLYVVVSQRQRALKLVEQRTAQLRQREQELRGTHGQLRSVLNAATQVAIIATDLRGVITTFNAGAEQMLGFEAQEVLGHLTLESLHLAPELEARAAQLSAILGKRIAPAQAMLVDSADAVHEAREWTLVRKDGSQLTVNMLATVLLDEHGLWVGHLAICLDVTEQKRAYEALAARDRLLKKLSAHVPGGIFQFILEPNNVSRFIYASDGIRDIYEIEPGVLQQDARKVFERIHPLDVERVRESIRLSTLQLSHWREEYRVQLPHRGLRWVRGEATPEELAGGGTLWHGYVSDISDLKRVEEELRALSITDSLTGIHNRRYFQDRLKAEMIRVKRASGALSVIMFDIDHFKRINDQHGHAVGDEVLKELCRRISQRLRRTDVFCRLGGEEFVVLCANTDGSQAFNVALELWQALRGEPMEGVGTVTASFGVASWRVEEGVDSLLLRADSGVYAAKQAGRDRVEAERVLA
ncbi:MULTISPECIES: diguanylate cyclase [unclassified Pseudomonas]|uniref:sensor domain-containing diguanylate cyclase n=1 Tax=unclassified Pseudomonas TaxID=196821 RepID=UPI000C86DF5E|nr:MULTISPECIES: diguanylate cyclase [unclassified Pseudomonas]PMU13777.1 GGDEF domain-containing protein [Pseudomonas sp. GP01-A9]PMU19152.1 GGDEF domain-containing protein [Pseudomonas sp. GP01-A13]PMU31650.1 GGDEF domain-containing protein [Pseudomonas sp. GP01-A8]PMU46043.1 GGDEF domain-containing protein [Pseudomonas sp. GP01-A14]PMU47333.1 GGDEF domain-containing protein [Pseudomonas sp. GP01-A6]